jgi:hypothetical protein
MKCQMLAGRCTTEATLELNAGGKWVHSLDLVSLKIVKHRAATRRIVACDAHETNLQTCAEMHGGSVKRIA